MLKQGQSDFSASFAQSRYLVDHILSYRVAFGHRSTYTHSFLMPRFNFIFPNICHLWRLGPAKLGCIILPKVLWYMIDPPDPNILTTNSSPSEKKIKKIHFKGWSKRYLVYVYAVLSSALPKKCFYFKILLSKVSVSWNFKIIKQKGSKYTKT